MYRPMIEHLSTEEKVAEIRFSKIEVGALIYAELDNFCVYQIVRVMEVNDDNIVVERAYPTDNDGWRRGTWAIPLMHAAKW